MVLIVYGYSWYTRKGWILLEKFHLFFNYHDVGITAWFPSIKWMFVLEIFTISSTKNSFKAKKKSHMFLCSIFYKRLFNI